ncbi:hypothetical protein ACFO1B_09550 [Dactylosporangium siamense]|uniref:DUF4878 domain-containing protein n=1 Tax=Dactylosporangium siamense TaxID=685454 RepID=A0A919PTC0_9ACTN|nr:hypothetical protein [Dactylosporangium siamense]GIG48936.1 hypothetical protein Dsi01nite_069770 [Dactylosporangium siamense]
MTYPGGPPEPYQPQPPYAPQPPVQGQPYGQYLPQPVQQPPPGGEQRGGKGALLVGGAVLLLILAVVGGYFTYQKVFVQTPTEVVEAYLSEVASEHPDAGKVEKYLCKEEAAKLRKDLANDTSSGSSRSTILEWHVTGETVSGSTASVYAQFTIKITSSGRTSTNNLTLTLVQEDGGWKICGYGP